MATKKVAFKLFLLTLTIVLMANPVCAQNESLEEAENLMIRQLSSLKDGDLHRFTENGNRMFKELLDEYAFDSLKMQHSANLAKGYKLEYLGSIRRIGMEQHLWKIHITGKKYQLLGSLALSHGMVVGFTLD